MTTFERSFDIQERLLNNETVFIVSNGNKLYYFKPYRFGDSFQLYRLIDNARVGSVAFFDGIQLTEFHSWIIRKLIEFNVTDVIV